MKKHSVAMVVSVRRTSNTAKRCFYSQQRLLREEVLSFTHGLLVPAEAGMLERAKSSAEMRKKIFAKLIE